MSDLRLPLRWAGCLAIGLAFSFPTFAQQDDGPMPPAARQEPVQPAPPQPPLSQTSPQNPASTPTAATAPENSPPSSTTPGPTVEIPSGTTIPLVLHNGISTHSAKVGDPIYFETLFPIMIAGRVAIPAGSYVSGEVTETKRAGRVKGRAELMIKLNTLILTNGYMVNLNAVPHNAGTGGGETVDNEGKVIGDSSKGADVGTIAKTTAAGAGIGGIATRTWRRYGHRGGSWRRGGTDGCPAYARAGCRVAARNNRQRCAESSSDSRFGEGPVHWPGTGFDIGGSFESRASTQQGSFLIPNSQLRNKFRNSLTRFSACGVRLCGSEAERMLLLGVTAFSRAPTRSKALPLPAPAESRCDSGRSPCTNRGCRWVRGSEDCREFRGAIRPRHRPVARSRARAQARARPPESPESPRV